jgi:tetratricopeptide (TPR) repeat protein
VPPLRAAFRLAPAESRKEVIDVLLDSLLAAATANFKKGDFQPALDYLKEAGALASESPEIRAELVGTLAGFSASLLTQGRFTAAVSTFEEAVKVAPANVNAHIGLARAFFSSGDVTRAYGAILNALDLDPASAEAQTLFFNLLSPLGEGLPE